MSDTEKKMFGEPDKGMLISDMPVRLGNQLRRRVQGMLLTVNASVRVGRWEDRVLIEGIVSEVMQEATPEERERADVRYLGQHQVSDGDLTIMARKAAVKQMQELHKSLQDRIAAVPGLIQKGLDARKIDVNDVSKRKAQKIRTVIRDVQKRSENTGRLSTLLCIEDSLKGWAGMVKDLLVQETAALDELKKTLVVVRPAKAPKVKKAIA